VQSQPGKPFLIGRALAPPDYMNLIQIKSAVHFKKTFAVHFKKTFSASLLK
jgi:hypothetical protein